MSLKHTPQLPTEFDEAMYLAANADVRKAVEDGTFASGAAHFIEFGWNEGRDLAPVPLETWPALGMDGLPLPSPDLSFLVTNGKDPVRFQQAGEADLAAVRRAVREAGVELPASGLSVLDWGCGCGRLARYWANEPGINLCGCDINETLINWCRDHLIFGSFATSPFKPPLSYNDGSFDLLYGISVLTHLTFEEHYLWMCEIYRLVKPNGAAVLTAHGTTMLPQILQGAQAAIETPGSRVKVDLIDEDAFVCLEREAGSNASGNVLTGNIFDKIFFPFEVLLHKPRYGLMGIHDTYVIRRKSSGSLTFIEKFASFNLSSANDSYDVEFVLDGESNFCCLIDFEKLYWPATAQLTIRESSHQASIMTSTEISVPHAIAWTGLDRAYAMVSLDNIPSIHGPAILSVVVKSNHNIDIATLHLSKAMFF